MTLPDLKAKTVEPTDNSKPHKIIIDEKWAGLRLDALLVQLYPDYSRTLISKAIKAGLASIDGVPTKPSALVRIGQSLVFRAPENDQVEPSPDASVELNVIHQDENILVINKQAGLTVHPTHLTSGPTLTGALLALDGEISKVGQADRPGIVHRLDKDTTGVMVIAKNQTSYDFLQRAFADRLVDKRYLAFVRGQLPDQGTIDTPIGRHPTQRHKMLASPEGFREAKTSFRVIRRFPKTQLALVLITLMTGRTHQARVHLASIGAPVLADRVYGRGYGNLVKIHPSLGAHMDRQFLHARKLTIPSPSGDRLTFRAPWPLNFRSLLDELLRLERDDHGEKT
ncbi:MAG: RluA family pseudouridine synthase [Deltaproteobacteria bacterium]|jgi:23S rRNA pseudouridine1911/1915/1917 synthase|nr:RluA family pseudouridine synthase [Deltaproteobacteria bacterium]